MTKQTCVKLDSIHFKTRYTIFKL